MRSLVILHGLFGSSRNWQSITKRIATEIPSKPLHALNLRNHGILNNTKPIIGPIESWETLRKDLEEFWINDLDGNDFDLLGHSFGGQVAMNSVLSGESSMRTCIKKLIIVDVSLRNPSNDVLYKLMTRMIEINSMKLNNRSEVIQALQEVEKDQNVINFLLLNLVKSKDTFTFKNLNIEEITAAWPILKKTWKRNFLPWDGLTLFLKGENSDYINKSDEVEITKYFPNSEIEIIEKSGHWPHIENPTDFTNKLLKFIS